MESEGEKSERRYHVVNGWKGVRWDIFTISSGCLLLLSSLLNLFFHLFSLLDLCFSISPYANKPSTLLRGPNHRERWGWRGWDIKEKQEERSKKVNARQEREGGRNEFGVGTDSEFVLRAEIQALKFPPVAISRAQVSWLAPRLFHPSSATSAGGEKPSPEQNKARNGGITESLSEWLNGPKAESTYSQWWGAETGSWPLSPAAPWPFGFDWFRSGKKRKKKGKKVKILQKYEVQWKQQL